MKAKSKLCMLMLAAMIWGFAFTAQTVGADDLGPLTFNAVRFTLGGLVLIPFRRVLGQPSAQSALKPGILCGAVLCLAIFLQQLALPMTTVPKAGFLSVTYIVMVPLLGLFRGIRVHALQWLCVLIALVGAYFLCIKGGDFRLAMGDTLVLLSSLAFSMHILLIDHFAPHTDPLTLSCVQFLACGAISGAFMLFFEQPTLSGLCNATLPLLYTGLLSSGVAYTLQVFAQKSVPPVVASLVLSLESVFALIGSFLLLGQTITAREGLGCALIFVATLLAQLPVPTKKVRKNRKCDILDL